MTLRRLLVVAYYTPPLGLSGVMRVTKLCKFLPEAGWRPLILTVKPVAYYSYDPELLNDLAQSRIYRTESIDPNRVMNVLRARARRLTPALSKVGGAGPRALNSILFPDSKIGWFPFGSSIGRHIIDEQKPAAIFATSPPFTSLLLGVRLKAHAGVPLVCDFRDPWPTGFASPPSHQRAALRRLRRYFVEHADLTLAVNEGTARQVGPGVEVLDNGFDPTEFEVEPERLPGQSILHVGNLWQNEAQVLSFVAALKAVPGAKLYLAGGAGDGVRRSLAGNPQVEFIGTVTHARACALMKGAHALLYIGKPNQPAGIKLYEYLGAGKPVLVWGEGAEEAAGIVASVGAGIACGTDPARLVSALAETTTGAGRFASGNRDRFNRRCQAQWLANRLEDLVLNS